MTDLEKVSRAIREYLDKIKEGCQGCVFEDKEEWEMPCKKCKRNCRDYWREVEGQ